MKWLCRNLKTILPKLGEKRPWIGDKRERVYYGIGLLVGENTVQDVPELPPAPKEILTKAQVKEFFANMKA